MLLPSPAASYTLAVRNLVEIGDRMTLNKIKWIIFLQVFSILVFIYSCEVDRSNIIAVEQPQYSYNYINDYEFASNRYFFLDAYYVDRYERGFSEDLQIWLYESGTLIKELNIYKSASYSNNMARKGVATIPSRIEEFYNIPNLDGISTFSGEIELAEFVPLKEGLDYGYNDEFGYFYLSHKIRDTEILAVAYRTDNDTVGTLLSMMSDEAGQFYVLRLIKSQSMRDTHAHVWPLMMRNVYFLGDTNFVHDGFNINIRKKDNHETYQDIEPKKRFTHLLGLDLIDTNGNLRDGGDGQVDNNYNLIDLREGILFFPGLNPFDPLPDSRFQIADRNRVRIYDIYHRSLNYPGVDSSKFEIVVQYINK
jgi:hypothetical protein